MAACGFNLSDDCVRVVRNTKTIQVPCTRNKCQQYTVKIPRQITNQIPRTLHYTDYESRQKSIPYTVNRPEKRTRMETQKYTVPVTSSQTRMVPVTRKVPKTVYVNVTTQVPQTYTTTSMQTRERQVPVPYYVNVPETKYRTVTEQVPVQRTKVQMDTVTKTVYDPQVRTHCVPETKMVTKQIPVYNVVAKPAPPCPPGADCGNAVDFNRIDRDGDGTFNPTELSFGAADTKMDAQLPPQEYLDARYSGNHANTAVYGTTDFSHGVAYQPAGYDLGVCTNCEAVEPRHYM